MDADCCDAFISFLKKKKKKGGNKKKKEKEFLNANTHG